MYEAEPKQATAVNAGDKGCLMTRGRSRTRTHGVTLVMARKLFAFSLVVSLRHFHHLLEIWTLTARF
jgi:hypothetical protein